MLGDAACDSVINPETEQYVVWAVGVLGETAFKHTRRAECKSLIIHTVTDHVFTLSFSPPP